MSAPTPAPGDDRPREGYYPDPSIPGYVRYWNGAAWVPGTSRPAPANGEPLAPPPGAAPSVEETGPHFFDEDPVEEVGPAVPESQHGSRPEPASAWGADRSRQSGFGGDQDRRVSWGTDPRVPHTSTPQQKPETSADTPEPKGSAAAGNTFVFRRPTPGPGTAEPSDAADDDQGTITFRAVKPRTADRPGNTGAAASAGARGSAADAGGSGSGAAGQRPGGAGASSAAAGVAGAAPGGVQGAGGAGAGSAAAPSGPAGTAVGAAGPGRPGFQAGQAAAARAAAGQAGAGAPGGSGAPAGTGTSGPSAARAATGAAAPASPAGSAPAAAPTALSGPQQAPDPSAVPPQSGAPAAQAGIAAAAPSAVPPQTGVPGGAPLTSGPGGGQSSWAQQVHRLAGGDDVPVAPWKPPVEDPFQAAARRQASARPAGLGKRFAARLLDTLVLGALTAVAAVPLGLKAVDHVNAKIDAAKLSGETVTVWLLDGTTSVYLGIVLGVLLVAGVLTEVLPTVTWGRTLGKKLLGLEVRDIEAHEPPEFGAALRRWLVYSIPGLLVVGVVGVAWCLFDKPWRQCWHDKAAHTFVAG
ncbi:RDD family protein [Streptomyces sp. NPDC052012]|uniref:RDD family protein n=1 Tax=Streptomyces sp. NPDC052012 TaxID=3155051 RepID=UPI00344BE891